MQTQPSTSSDQIPPSPASGHSPFIPYHTTKHRVTKGRYITSNDPRGYIPVYEYPLNNQWVMMDVDDGYVLWTGIWKALGNAKADIVKMIESQPELESQLRRVRGGYLKIQGTWMPYEVALRLARRVAWPIREDLVPLFGPTFPSTCLSPDQPGYGQVLENSGRRRKRTNTQVAKLTANRDLHNSAFPTYAPRYPIHGLPQYRPPTPDYPPSSYLHPYPSHPHHPAYGHGSRGYEHGVPPHPPPYGNRMPLPPPHPGSPHGYPISPRMSMSSHDGRARRNSDSRRYAPYPHRPPSSHHQYGPSSSEMPTQGGGFNLPPISAIGFGQPGYPAHPGHPGGEPAPRQMLERPLPPIGNLREGYTQSMDTASVLRRLKIDDGNNAAVSQQSQGPIAGPSPLTPLGSRHEMPSDKYMESRRRSLSAPPPHQFYPSQQDYGVHESHHPHPHAREHGYHSFSRPTHHYSRSGETPGYHADHNPPLGPHRRERQRSFHGAPYEHRRHNREPVSTRPSSPSSFWTQTPNMRSPTHSTDRSPPSPLSSPHGRWSPPTAEPKIWEVGDDEVAAKAGHTSGFVSTEGFPPSVRLRARSQEDELMSDSDGSPRGSPQLPMREVDMTDPANEFERRPHLIPVSDVRRSPVTGVAPIAGGGPASVPGSPIRTRLSKTADRSGVRTPVSPVTKRPLSATTSAKGSPSGDSKLTATAGAVTGAPAATSSASAPTSVAHLGSPESSPRVRVPIRPW